jgi:hypothetical protein
MLRRRRRPVKVYEPTVPPPDPPPTGELTPHLPFDMPNLATSPKKVLAHYFYYPISLDNLQPNADYYANNWMTQPNQTGGAIKTRPVPNAPLAGNFKRINCTRDVVDAYSAGIDGFFVDIQRTDRGSSAAWALDFFTELIAAAAARPGFYVVPMIDVSTIGPQSPSLIAQFILEYQGKASTWMDGGYMVVGSYMTGTDVARGCNGTWWGQVAAACHALGFDVKFAHVYSGNVGDAPSLAANAYSCGQWGPKADAAIPIGSTNPSVASVHARGEKYLSPVWITDVRPGLSNVAGSSVWSESLNTLCLTNYWTEVINVNPEIVQMCTWSDYSEGSEFQNNTATGLVPADISAYYMVKWKTGSFPTIVRDALYLSYRSHVNNAPILGPQTQFMTKWTTGSATRYAVEALTFLKTAADVTVTINGVTTTFTNVPAGVQRNVVTVTAAGTVSGTIRRAGVTVVSLNPPTPIRPTLWFEDKHYHMFGSLRGTTGQFDVSKTSTGVTPVYPSAPVPGTVLFRGDYSTNNFNQWQYVQNRNYNAVATGYTTQTYPATLSTVGSEVIARFEVRGGDLLGSTERSEVSGYVTGSGSGAEGETNWTQFKIKLDPTFPDVTSAQWTVLTQWHHNSNVAGSPPMSLNASSTNRIGLDVHRSRSITDQDNPITIWSTPQNRGTWHTIKLQVTWSVSDTTGMIRLWHDGVAQTFTNGSTTYNIRTLIPGATPNYIKEGLYRAPRAETGIVYRTGLVIATTEAALDRPTTIPFNIPGNIS